MASWLHGRWQTFRCRKSAAQGSMVDLCTELVIAVERAKGPWLHALCLGEAHDAAS